MKVKALRCPACSASLEIKVPGEATIRCAYCSTTIVVPAALREGGQEGEADELNEVERLLEEGRKIEAIRAYRQLMGVGLKEAKATVEALQRGEPVAMALSAPRPTKRSRGCSFLMLLAVLLLVVTAIYLLWSLLGGPDGVSLSAALGDMRNARVIASVLG